MKQRANWQLIIFLVAAVIGICLTKYEAHTLKRILKEQKNTIAQKDSTIAADRENAIAVLKLYDSIATERQIDVKKLNSDLRELNGSALLNYRPGN